jgi:hypothetical protein
MVGLTPKGTMTVMSLPVFDDKVKCVWACMPVAMSIKVKIIGSKCLVEICMRSPFQNIMGNEFIRPI